MTAQLTADLHLAVVSKKVKLKHNIGAQLICRPFCVAKRQQGAIKESCRPFRPAHVARASGQSPQDKVLYSSNSTFLSKV